MTDNSSPVIDPDRPWIDDARDDPRTINWIKSLTNPFGSTSRVHFTRAWTGLFFTRVLYVVALWVLGVVLGLAGVSDPAAMLPPAWVWPLLVLVTAVLSLILHVRRLTDAQRNPLWAIIVIVPVLFGLAGFVAGIGQGVQVYQGETDRIAGIEREAPAPPVADTGSEGEPGAEGETSGEARHGPPPPPPVNVNLVSERDFALQQGMGLAQMVWAPFSLLAMLWSLFWVGRLPNDGGTIRSRFEDAKGVVDYSTNVEH